MAACELDHQPNLSAAQPRGASVAFDSIEGLPHAQFQTLVQDLNDEAQTRRLAVVSREKSSAYRVRGYLAAEIAKNKTTISWVWDLFDSDQHRALRISGTTTADSGRNEGWAAVDEATLRKIADSSMAQIATFLTSPTAVPGTPTPAPTQMTLASLDASTPEAAGIFRIFHPHADPVPAAAPPPGQNDAGTALTPVSVPLPPRRPSFASADATMTLTARATP